MLGRKVMTNLDSILKSRDITLPPLWVCLIYFREDTSKGRQCPPLAHPVYSVQACCPGRGLLCMEGPCPQGLVLLA